MLMYKRRSGFTFTFYKNIYLTLLTGFFNCTGIMCQPRFVVRVTVGFKEDLVIFYLLMVTKLTKKNRL